MQSHYNITTLLQNRKPPISLQNKSRGEIQRKTNPFDNYFNVCSHCAEEENLVQVKAPTGGGLIHLCLFHAKGLV